MFINLVYTVFFFSKESAVCVSKCTIPLNVICKENQVVSKIHIALYIFSAFQI